MHQILWARQATFVAVLVVTLCVTACRSHMDTAFDECLRRSAACALEIASMEVERRPTCCDCIARLALAQKHDALSRMQSLSPSELTRSLSRAAAEYERAAQCGRGNAAYADAATETMRRYREIAADEDPAHWDAIAAIEDRDRRIEAVIAHATFHGGRCRHDVAGEYRAYVAEMGSASTAEIRRRLTALAATPVAEELFRLYLARRVEEAPASAEREIQVLEQMRVELYGTPYAGMAERSLADVASASEDPRQVDQVCQRISAGADRRACEARAQALWAAAIVGAPVRQLVEICPRIDAPAMRAHCQTALAEEALKLVTEEASDEDLALAETVLRKADERYRREWRIRLLRRDAERNFSRIVAYEPELRLELVESVSVWTDFLDVFDTLARKVSNNEEESLRSIHPRLVRQIAVRRETVSRNADSLFRRRARECREMEKKLSAGNRGVRPDGIRRCVADLAVVLTMDETHHRARKLLNELEDAASKVSIRNRTEWSTVAVPLLLTEALRSFVSPTLARLVFRTMRAVEF